jgi:uncharacterized protein (DUF1800 family)
MMGVYLSMLGNRKPNAELNIRPDENYARELMQLFTIGLVSEMIQTGSFEPYRSITYLGMIVPQQP